MMMLAVAYDSDGSCGWHKTDFLNVPILVLVSFTRTWTFLSNCGANALDTLAVASPNLSPVTEGI